MSDRRLELDVGGLVRTVHVAGDGARFRVDVDGRPHEVDAAEVAPGRWSLIVDGAASREVVVRNARAGGDLSVHVDGAIVPVALRDPGRARRGSAAGDGPARVVAPMPGKVVRVLVAPGDAVSIRQGLVVVEAMKMENELRAPRAGTVTEVFAEEGAVVDLGAVLITIA